jgi:phosphatidylethanolamine/phosphatidyl-N-methylethanolamine N-methyltransferase
VLIKDIISFVRQAVLHPVSTGAGLPTSRWVATTMANALDIAPGKRFIELGCGTGPMTRQIVAQLDQLHDFFVVELSPAFCKIVQKKFPDVKVYQDTYENLSQLLHMHQWASVDGVISGIPWANFSKDRQCKGVELIHEQLAEGGVFVAFTYYHSAFLQSGKRFAVLLEQQFSEVHRSRLEFKNLPPAYVYRCVK